MSQASTDGPGSAGAEHVAMSPAPATDHQRVVIAGGGVAALEGCLALRERLSAADLEITLLSPGQRFDYRPLSVLQPFRGISRWSVALSTFAADQDVTIVNDALTAIAPHARVAVTGAGDEIPYDAMLVATGGHAADAVPGALSLSTTEPSPPCVIIGVGCSRSDCSSGRTSLITGWCFITLTACASARTPSAPPSSGVSPSTGSRG